MERKPPTPAEFPKHDPKGSPEIGPKKTPPPRKDPPAYDPEDPRGAPVRDPKKTGDPRGAAGSSS